MGPAELLAVPTTELLAAARERRRGDGLVTYSPKVFVPLTTLCRDVCGYCTFARPPRRGERAYLTEERVLEETGLLPHLNPGVMSRAELELLRPVSASMGIMLETTAERLAARRGPHWASPDKLPAARLETIALAGELRIPFTSGILIGIGETRAERLDALLALAGLHERHGHLQEVIVQNFRAKPGTRMAGHPEPTLDEHLWTIAAARLLLPVDVSVQAPPNLAYDDFPRLLDAGIDDWGGVSPVTIDHVNPEAPWPERERLAAATRSRGLELAPRLPVYPGFLDPQWLDPHVLPAALRASDALGLAREDRWHPGERGAAPFAVSRDALPLDSRDELGEEELVRLFRARGEERQRVFAAADRLRREVCGDEVSYVVTRNIQYTNVCYFRCGFCAFSKGRLAANLRGAPYLVPLEEIVRRSREAWERGATEVCLQGGIHPAFTGDYYASVVEAIRAEVPELHIHAFSALEVWQGAATLGLELEPYLERLRSLGLGSLPGTAAEILDDEVRALICPDKVTTAQWLAVHEAAHRVGLRSNVTIMFGHVESPRHWARHLLRAREQQERSGGFTELVPLPFVHMEAPMWLRGGGPARADVRRDVAAARGGAARAAPADREHPGLVGEARAAWRRGGAPRRRQRPRRDADERVDLARRRLRARAGAGAGGDGGADPRERPRAAAADDAVRRRAGGEPGSLLRRGAARRAAEPTGAGRGPAGAAPARPARPARPRALVAAAHDPRHAREPAREPPAGGRERALHGRSVRQPLTVADEHVLDVQSAERARRSQPQERVDAHRLGARAEEGDGAEDVGADEDPAFRPPERDLVPEPHAQHGAELERRAGERAGHDVERHAEPRREGRAVALVPVEQLDHARRLAERPDPLVDAVTLDRVDDPHSAVRCEGMRGPPQPRRLDPAEHAVELVDEPDAHGDASWASACSKTASGCAPRTSSRRSSRNAGTALAPIETARRVESWTTSWKRSPASTSSTSSAGSPSSPASSRRTSGEPMSRASAQ